MEYVNITYLIVAIILFLGICELIRQNLQMRENIKNSDIKFDAKKKILSSEIQLLKDNQIDVTNMVPKDVYNTTVDELEFNLNIAKDRYLDIQERYNKMSGQMKSKEVKLGLVAEQILPFLDSFPYNSKNIVGIYKPIDLIAFEEDKVVFIEIKSGGSKLGTKQRHIKKLIDDKQVFFETHRINEKGYEVS